MLHPFSIDISSYNASNNLWSDLIEKLGLERAYKAARQALDMQLMQGNPDTLPVLLFETCGLALINTDLVSSFLGIPVYSSSMLVILSRKSKSFQLLRNL